MTKVNIFGASLPNENNISVRRGPSAIGFEYLDGLWNYDIGKKRLANVGEPSDSFAAINRDYTENPYMHLKEEFERFCINHNNYITKLNELKTSYDQFITSNDRFKSGSEVKIESAELFQDRLYQTQVKLQDCRTF